ncbi:MAG TPA: YbjN domain-containing protein [Thermoanaerobaculia bacterium]|nr:YbjN domain-containing protein [Thermoanaerobaculia bacterium]
MDFAHAVHRDTHQRIEEYLGELFEDPYHDPDNGHFYVRYGSTVLEIAVDPYGPEETMVQVMAYCVQGVRLEPDLMLGLLELNHHLAFGAFSLVGRDIFLSHTLFGRALDRGSLLGAIAAVANVADEYDDRIVAKYGGQTALDRIRDTGGKKRRAGERDPAASHPR